MSSAGRHSVRRALPLLLLMGFLSGCMGSHGLLRAPRVPSREILQSPQIESAAEQFLEAAHDAVVASQAPDASQQWLIPPAVSGNGDWEASALCFALASRNGRLRPFQPPGQIDTVAAIQAWLRATSSTAVVWMVESSGMFSPDLDLVICSANQSWRSESFTVDVAKELRFAWPLDPDENPPLAALSVQEARSLREDGSEVYLESREGSRRIQWHGRSLQLELGKLRASSTGGESGSLDAHGVREDPTPPLMLMSRDLHLILSDADLPEGEGEFEQWSLSRGGNGMELPLSRVSETQIVAIAAAPDSWNEPGTWLVLRRKPSGEGELQLFAAALRERPQPPRLGPPPPEETLRIATDFTWPLLLAGLGEELSITHQLQWNRGYHAPLWEQFAQFTPRFPDGAPLSFWTLAWRTLSDVRLRHLDPPMHVVRFSPLASEFSDWSAAVAKKPLVFGDTARWRVVPAAPVWGIARVSPGMPAKERHALVAWLSSLGPFELFGLDRNDLSPSLPLSGRERPSAPGEESSLRGLALTFSFDGCPGIVDRLPGALRQELEDRLSFLAKDRGATLSAPGAGTATIQVGSGVEASEDCALAGEHRVDFGRLVLPKGSKRERATALLRACGLLQQWKAAAARQTPDPSTLSDDELAVEIENWLLQQDCFVPLWSEEGRVFVDRRVAGLLVDPQAILPDLSEAHLLPREQLKRFGLQP